MLHRYLHSGKVSVNIDATHYKQSKAQNGTEKNQKDFFKRHICPVTDHRFDTCNEKNTRTCCNYTSEVSAGSRSINSVKEKFNSLKI